VVLKPDLGEARRKIASDRIDPNLAFTPMLLMPRLRERGMVAGLLLK
jgi:hypothetical protein